MTNITATPATVARAAQVRRVVLGFVQDEIDHAVVGLGWCGYFCDGSVTWTEVGTSVGREAEWPTRLAWRLLEVDFPWGRLAEEVSAASAAGAEIHAGEGEYIALANAHMDEVSRLVHDRLARHNARVRKDAQRRDREARLGGMGL